MEKEGFMSTKREDNFIKTLFQCVPENMSQTRCAKMIGVSDSRYSSIKLLKSGPSSEEVKRMIDVFDIDVEKLRKIAKKEVLYKHWDVLYPESAKIEKIYIVMKDELEKQGLSRNYLKEKLGVRSGYLSRIFCGKLKMSYPMYIKMCHALHLDEDEAIYRLQKIDSDLDEQKKELTLIIKSAREKLGYSYEDVAKKVGLQPGKYKGYENGEYIISVVKLARIAAVLDLDFDKVYNLAKESRQLGNYKLYDKAKQQYMNFQAPEGNTVPDIIPLFMDIASLKTIKIDKDGSYKYGEVSGNTLVTLLILILSNSTLYEKNKLEILFYLKNIDGKGVIGNKLLRQGCENLSTGEILTKYREESGLTFANLSEITNLTRGYLSTRFNSDTIPMYFGTELCQLIGMPGSVVIERNIEKYLARRKVRKEFVEYFKNNEPSQRTLMPLIKTNDKWMLWDYEVDSNLICQLISIIGRSENPVDRYKEIMELEGLSKDGKLKIQK